MKVGERKMILAKGCVYSLDDFETRLTNNVLILGSSGSGKTWGIVRPNLFQSYGSYIVSDPKGCLYNEFKAILESRGYKVYLLDFKTPKNSHHFNILEYVNSDDEIIKLASMIMKSSDQLSARDPYWAQAGEKYIAAVIALVKNTFPKSEQNMKTITDIITSKTVPFFSKEEYFRYYAYVKENNIPAIDKNNPIVNNENCFFAIKEPIKPVDLYSYFEYLKSKGPSLITSLLTSVCDNRESAQNAKESIFMEGQHAMRAFATESIKEMLSKSDFNIIDIGNEKTAVFVSASDTDRSQDMLVNIFYSMCLNKLCDYADTECKGNRLPVDVRFILDDFATNCKIADFDKSIAMIRSRGISTMLMVQDINQLETCYGRGGSTICANCDTWAYLGGNDMNTIAVMARQVNEPFDTLHELSNDYCYIYRRGERPRKAKKITYNDYMKILNNNDEEVA